MTSAGELGSGPGKVRIAAVRAPKLLLPLKTEMRLTVRQRQILDQLEELVVEEGLADVTMAQLAARLNCSLRTLYGISPSKDELVLTVADRRLHRIGRSAIESLDPDLPPLEALRAYLGAANEAVHSATGALTSNFVAVPGAGKLVKAHEKYLIAVVRSFLDRALVEGQICRVDTAAVAHVLGGLGREFARVDVAVSSDRSPKETADDLTEIILRGLEKFESP